MKIRLKVTTAEQVFMFEHAGPVIRIGREESCQLALEAGPGTVISRQHAHIDLTHEGALLTNDSASNGTLLNDQMVAGPTPLSVGDRIRLGYTGPALQVLALELPSARRTSRLPWPVFAGGGILVGVFLLLFALFLFRSNETTAEVTVHVSQPDAQIIINDQPRQGTIHDSSVNLMIQLPVGSHTLQVNAPGKKCYTQSIVVEKRGQLDIWVPSLAADSPSVVSGKVFVRVNKDGARLFIDGKLHTVAVGKEGVTITLPVGLHQILVTSQGVSPWQQQVMIGPDQTAQVEVLFALDRVQAKTTLPPPRPVALGEYVSSKEKKENRLSLLLRRDNDSESFKRVERGDTVFAGDTLLSLPGFESGLLLGQNAVLLTLWGSLPTLSGTPALESNVLLFAPAAEYDADFSLERGRVYLRGRSNRSTKVKLRFLNEAWDLILKDDKSQAWIELHTSLHGEGSRKESRADSQLLIYCSGKVDMTVPQINSVIESRDPAKMIWAPRRSLIRNSLERLPVWLTSPPNIERDDVKATVDGLAGWLEQFDQSSSGGECIDMIKKLVADPAVDRIQRSLGMLFLAAVDEPVPLVKALADESDLWDLRCTATGGLLAWLSRDRNGERRLLDVLDSLGYQKADAKLVVRLLQVRQPERMTQAELGELAQNLNHTKLAVRHLAAWHLYVALASIDPSPIPVDAWKIRYSPIAPEEKRAEAVRLWEKVKVTTQVSVMGSAPHLRVR